MSPTILGRIHRDIVVSYKCYMLILALQHANRASSLFLAKPAVLATQSQG